MCVCPTSDQAVGVLADVGAVVLDDVDELHAHGVHRGPAGGGLLVVAPGRGEQVLEPDPQAVAHVHAQHQRARPLVGAQPDVAGAEHVAADRHHVALAGRYIIPCGWTAPRRFQKKTWSKATTFAVSVVVQVWAVSAAGAAASARASERMRRESRPGGHWRGVRTFSSSATGSASGFHPSAGTPGEETCIGREALRSSTSGHRQRSKTAKIIPALKFLKVASSFRTSVTRRAVKTERPLGRGPRRGGPGGTVFTSGGRTERLAAPPSRGAVTDRGADDRRTPPGDLEAHPSDRGAYHADPGSQHRAPGAHHSPRELQHRIPGAHHSLRGLEHRIPGAHHSPHGSQHRIPGAHHSPRGLQRRIPGRKMRPAGRIMQDRFAVLREAAREAGEPFLCRGFRATRLRPGVTPGVSCTASAPYQSRCARASLPAVTSP